MSDFLGSILNKNSNKSNSIKSNSLSNSSSGVSNYSRNSSYTANSSKNNFFIIGIIGFILVIVLIIVIVVLVNRAKAKRENVFTIIKSPLDAFDIKPDQGKFQIANSEQGLEFSYSVWIFIQDWTRGWKNIFVKGDRSDGSGNNASRAPGLWLYPDTNALHARINTFASPNEGCDIKNIPLQKWVHIAYILNNRTVDIYIDGKLERSCVLRGVPKLNNNPLYVCDNGGFFGKISNMVYYKHALKPNDVYNIYSQGPY